MLYGKLHQRRHILEAQLLHKAAAIGLDGLDREEQDRSCLRAGLSLGDQLQDLALARAEALQHVARALAYIILQHGLGDLAAEVSPYLVDGADGFHHLFTRRFLQQVAHSTGLQSALDLANRSVKGYSRSKRTHYIFQPAIGSFYEGAQYSHKELVSARDPWSGALHYDAAVYVMGHFTRFAKTGWENDTNTAGIWRTVPQAMRGVVVAVMVISLTLPAVALSALPVENGSTLLAVSSEEGGYADNPILGVVVNLGLGDFQPAAELYVGLLAATILFIATNAAIIGVSRLVYSMGIHRQMPDRLRQLHPKYGTPWIGILIFGGMMLRGRLSAWALLIDFILVIALSTVKWHINNLFGKLGVHSRTQAVAQAKELGLL